MDATRARHGRSTDRRWRVAVAGALVGALALLAAACEAPTPAAGRVFDAWKAGHANTATADATPAAISFLVAHPYNSTSKWAFGFCNDIGVETPCLWFNRIDSELILVTDHATGKVADAAIVVHPVPVAGSFFHTWRIGDRAGAAAFATPAAVTKLFAHTYDPAAHWEPGQCDGAAGSIYCTWWKGGPAHSITLRYDNVQSHVVTDVLFDVADPSTF